MPFDDVLSTAPPGLSLDEAVEVARDLFGVTGPLTEMGSERDRTFRIDGDHPAVMKISNEAEDPARLDLEASAAFCVTALDASLPVALPWLAPGGTEGDPASYRATMPSTGLMVRMYDVLPGEAETLESALPDAAVRAWGSTVARLGRAMRALSDPAAHRVMLWDPQHALVFWEMLDAVEDARIQRLVERALDRFEEVVVPAWPLLRQQVIHGDLSADNALVNQDGMISGIIDFGDMSYTALMVDIVSVIESMVSGRSGDEVFRTARLAIDGFEEVVPLEPLERSIMAELLAARACAAAVVPVWRSRMYDDPDAVMPGHRQDADDLLTLLDETGWDEANRRLGGREPGSMVAFDDLRHRRATVLGSALTDLTYDEPLHIVRGSGAWLFDADGGRYLDAYNNVPVVGHCHPRVTGAIARQARVLNTNMRYLHETVIELAERLCATTDGVMDTVMFVNSGSEANDLAWRIATTVTGNTGGLCTSFAYHGVSEAIIALSPESWPRGEKPAHVETWEPPDAYRGTALDGASFAAALDRMAAAGRAPALAILDGALMSDGVIDVEVEQAQDWVRQTHEAGGLWVADEVQGGYGRTGAAMWSYQRLGIVPDFVTLGKPMGNGHPVAAVITRSDIIDRFAAATDYFSTFGGNPVATAAASAVLDVIEDEGIVANAQAVGEYLRERLRAVQADHPEVIGDVRGFGLATGVEFVTDAVSKAPDGSRANRVMNDLRRHGVLVGSCGPEDNTLKVRPPLIFTREHADLVATTLHQALGLSSPA